MKNAIAVVVAVVWMTCSAHAQILTSPSPTIPPITNELSNSDRNWQQRQQTPASHPAPEVQRKVSNYEREALAYAEFSEWVRKSRYPSLGPLTESYWQRRLD